MRRRPGASDGICPECKVEYRTLGDLRQAEKECARLWGAIETAILELEKVPCLRNSRTDAVVARLKKALEENDGLA